MAIYSRIAGQVLGQKLRDLAELAPSERHSLADEIDVARVMVERALRMYDEVFFGSDSDKIKPELRVKVQENLKRSIDFVGSLVVKATRARMVDQTTVDVEQLDYVVKQVTRIVEEEIADHDKEMAARVVLRLREIRMPERGGNGKGLSAAELARALRAGSDAIMSGIEADEEDGEDDDDRAAG